MGEGDSSLRYADECEIARGGMGIVLKVKDRTLDRTLAMKRMLGAPDLAGGAGEVDRFARFMEEAHVTAQLDHPGIVPVHELGEDADGCAYYTMKLVRGRELGVVIKLARSGGEGWSLPRLVAVLVRVCQAVAYAHGKGVIHRDLKPANIMVGDLGEVYVMDWGLAKQLGREDVHDIRLKIGDELARSGMDTIVSPRSGAPGSSLDAPLMTMDGAVVGTPAYMPPEQAAGIVDQVDHLSDIYALGAVLYEILAAQTPYMDAGGNTSPQQVLTALSNGPPTKLKRIRPEAPAELVAICEKAMSRQREQRYQSCLEFAGDLQAFLDGRVVQAHHTGAFAELKKWVLRNKATSAAAAVAVLLLAALAVVQMLANRRLGESLASEEAARDQATNRLAGSYAANAFRHAGAGDTDHAVLWFTKAAGTTRDPQAGADHLVRVASWLRESFPLLRAFRSGQLDQHRLSFHPSGQFLGANDLDGFAVWDLQAERRVPLAGEEIVFAASWDASGDRLAVAHRGRNAVSVLAWPSGETEFEIAPVPGVKFYFAAAFDDTGERLALAGLWGFEIWSVPERRRLCHRHRPDESIHFIAFEAGGGRLITINGDRPRQIQVFAVEDRDGGELAGPLYPPIANDGSLALPLGEGGREFLVRKGNGHSAWHATASGELLREEPKSRSILASNGRGDLMVAGEGNQAVLLQNFGSDERARILLDDILTHAAFVPGGSGVLTATRSGRVAVYDTQSGKRVAPLSDHHLPVTGLTVSPDGSLAAIASGGGLIRVFQLERAVDRDGEQIPDTEFYRTYVALNPDGEHLAAAGEQRTAAKVFRVADPDAEPAVLPMSGSLLGLAFSMGGERLYGLSSPLLENREPDFTRGALEIWDWRAGSRIGEPVSLPSAPRSLAFDPSDQHRAAIWCAGGQALSCDLHGSETKIDLLFQTAPGSTRFANFRHGTVVFSPDGSALLAYGMPEGHVYVWDLAMGRMRFPPIEVPQLCHDLDFHPTEPIFSTASGTVKAGNVARFWSLADGTEVAAPVASSSWPYVGRFCGAGGEWFVVGGRGRNLRVYDWRAGGEPVASWSLPGEALAAVPMPGRPSWLLTTCGGSGDSALRLWDAESGQALTPSNGLRLYSSPLDLYPSVDGRGVFVAGISSAVTRFDLRHVHDPKLPLPSLAAFGRFAELRAGVTARDDGTEVDLEVDAWLQKWQALRAEFPAYPHWP